MPLLRRRRSNQFPKRGNQSAYHQMVPMTQIRTKTTPTAVCMDLLSHTHYLASRYMCDTAHTQPLGAVYSLGMAAFSRRRDAY